MTLLQFTFMFLLAAGTKNCFGPNKQPDAGPPAAGGSVATGGSAATGGALDVGGAVATGGAATGGQPSSLDDCALADAKLNQLNCSQAKTPKGKPFVDVCRAAAATHQNMHPECIAKVTACSQVSTAYRGCK